MAFVDNLQEPDLRDYLFRQSELGELLQKSSAVRQGVVMLTERAACMDYAENNDAEVQRVSHRPNVCR